MRFHQATIIAAVPALLGAVETAASTIKIVEGKKNVASSSTKKVATALADISRIAPPSSRTLKEEESLIEKRVFRKNRRKNLANRIVRARGTEKNELGTSANVDVGVLFLHKRSLQADESDDTEEYFCPRDQCPPELCDCAEDGGDMADCSSELSNACASGTLSGCVYPGYLEMYEELYCPFVSCLATDKEKGFNECDCDFYQTYCAKLMATDCLADNAGTAGEGDEADKTPFFGCEDSVLLEVCGWAEKCLAEIEGEGEGEGEGEQPLTGPDGAIGGRISFQPNSTAKARSSTLGTLAPMLLAAVYFARSSFFGGFAS